MDVPTQAPIPADGAARLERDVAIDWLRGVVMVLMVLDHARDFFAGFRARPTDLTSTTPVLFLTRFVTHFCAPVFVFLAGTAAFLYARRRSSSDRTRFLVSRGLWLVVLEITVIRLGWIPDLGYHFTVLQVIWALGWSMLALAGLAYLPMRAVLVTGAAMVLLHNLLDGIKAAHLGGFRWLFVLLHERAMLEPLRGHKVFVSYSLIPWIGVMALGYAFGSVALLAPVARRRLCVRLGLALTLGFVALRALNAYGDPVPWTRQASPLFTLMSFVNCEKYPPSLAFLLMTLGPALIAFAFAPTTAGSRVVRALTVFGRVPLFFYIAHLFLLRYTSVPIAFSRFGPRAFAPPPQGAGGSPELSLGWAYLAWLLALLLLYPACAWYAQKKAKSRSVWLSYL